MLSRETKLSGPEYFINGTEFKGIDVGADYKAVMGWRKALN
jgi:hypothetical protein